MKLPSSTGGLARNEASMAAPPEETALIQHSVLVADILDVRAPGALHVGRSPHPALRPAPRCARGLYRRHHHAHEARRSRWSARTWKPRLCASRPISTPPSSPPPQYDGAKPSRRISRPSNSSADALGQRLRKWCREAGLNDRSAHGVRKATGHLLASLGCSQFDDDMVPAEGLEPPTFGLQNRCSAS